ncbi:CRISPR-associated endonuclease Cas2 [Heliobacterium gestii]|uniref:CRISPR-associated endoribonuclease Cas2 n=1 Tax=Heliomicrobium gestii TaxID=2699 RepID=A0A845LGQ9_HELGE|nr:CRISPR-associated endonuclease Cas2 [Heliomicrobium gestii]MBM7865802.1 CRISPR-associated protein Cas2 [Heliomicrobium gestii]MZP42046.1 CRISPR-associated endonuclease Cas2 [Heliomicrobium gestii]
MEHYVVTYDIADDKRRSKVFKTLKDYGTHVQESVFEVVLMTEDYVELRHKLLRRIHRDEDSVIFYRQCRACEHDVERLGRKVELVGIGDIVL